MFNLEISLGCYLPPIGPLTHFKGKENLILKTWISVMVIFHVEQETPVSSQIYPGWHLLTLLKRQDLNSEELNLHFRNLRSLF